MKSNGRRRGASALCWAMGVILVACASAPPQKQEAWPEPKRSDWEHQSDKDDPCKGKGGEPVSCTSVEDCCKGYACTHDPERSRVTLYCLQS